jgi:gliding motility-associated-like protein
VAVVSKSGDSAPFDISCYDYSDGWAQSEPTGGVAATSGYNFNWQLSGSSFSTNYYVENLAAGNNYTVTVTDANGCVVSESTGLLTEPVDFIAAVGSDYTDPLNSPATVIFTDNTISSDPYNFTWNWADGNTEFYSNGTSTFNLDFTDKFGMNDIYVSLENELTGCIDSVGFKIEVQGIPEINNVFTPNGDNVNDFFSFSEYAMKEITVEIFNRWGQIVYSWNTPAYAWDGRDYDGRNLAEGVYYYVLSSQGEDGELYSEKGSITLLR